MTKTSDAIKILDHLIGQDQEIKEEIAKATLGFQVADLIYKARTKAGLTQKQLANLIGSKQPVIARLEDGEYEGHSLRMLQKIAEALEQKVSITFENLEAPKTSTINDLNQLILKQVDSWIEAGWQEYQNLRLNWHLPNLECTGFRLQGEKEIDTLTKAIVEAENIAESDPSNSLASVHMVKEFYDLGRPLVLRISVSQAKESDLVNVLLQVRCLHDEELPLNLQMTLLDGDKKPYQPVEDFSCKSKEKMTVITLPFQFTKNDSFILEIRRDDIAMYERFSV
jgi:transcriptional regulator with XRE-family HTH domain